MTDKIALCADSRSLENPSDLGLKGERILDQTWILPFADALIARQYLREHAVEETWVVSSDSIDGINLAAALKKDNERNDVRLLLSSPSGSKLSRCQNAGILPICGNHEFAQLYAAKKLERASARSRQRNDIEHDRAAEQTEQTRSGETDPCVTVTRIERTAKDPTGPLPTIEIEEAPQLADEREETIVPPRKAFAERSEEPAGEATDTQERPVRSPGRPLPSVKEGASIVSIVSGSGGTGKSSIAAIVALLSQAHGIRTLILDADFQFGDLKYLLGYERTFDTNDILEHPEQIDSLLKVDTWPALLAAPAQLEYSELMNEKIGELLSYLKPHFDLIVVNTASFWSELQIQLIEASNNVFFLVDQRPSSVRACNHALDLCARCGVATTSFSYLLNFCSRKSLLSALDVSCALKGAKVYEIKDGGSEVSELLGAGMAHKLSCISNPFCSSIEQLLAETVYSHIKPSLEPSTKSPSKKRTAANSKTKRRGRQKKKAACF